jgi:hypothetical protein
MRGPRRTQWYALGNEYQYLTHAGKSSVHLRYALAMVFDLVILVQLLTTQCDVNTISLAIYIPLP